MTYNVHRCVGGDGRHDPDRIAEVIAGPAPDVVALQELDVNRDRTGRINQPELIAARLDMAFHFSPAYVVEDGHYGNAILSRLPIRIMREGPLPRVRMPWRREGRGALWAAVSWAGADLNVIATHLGLLPSERRAQAAALLGSDWLGHAACRGPRVVCGDLNSLPGSAAFRRLEAGLVDAAASAARDGAQSVRTFPSLWPLLRLDHVFHSRDLRALAVHVPSNRISRLASDHLPFVVDILMDGGET
ncbi:MAG: endonuclease/exonuclease/phosphatase family protein [Deltaproteobacteria bacterium]|nr:endonuclease/exonuclease/phosphatase family protein [Deltaproteobacteria bacterium]